MATLKHEKTEDEDEGIQNVGGSITRYRHEKLNIK